MGPARNTFRALSFFSPWLERELFCRALDFATTLDTYREDLIRLVRRAQSSRKRAATPSANERSSMIARYARRYDKALRE
jgi:hypothetical protein